jgi:hypothetical protein
MKYDISAKLSSKCEKRAAGTESEVRDTVFGMA